MESSGLRRALSRAQDTLRTEIWPLPALGVSLAVVLGVLLPRLDAHVDRSLPEGVEAYLFGGGAGAARTILDAVASSLITVTSLTFSLTVVTLQLASSQFSPRLLRTFTRDRFVHVTLAIFLSTFTYALTVLRVVRTAEDGENGQDVFVPQISVTFAFVLALASVLGLVLFLAHLAREIRVETMLLNVHADAREVLVAHTPSADREHEWPSRPSTALLLLASSSGFLIRMNEVSLLRAAIRADAVVVIDRQPGSFLVAGTPIGACWPRGSTRFAADTRDELLEAVREAVQTGFERTASQDIGFGLRQLTDVATKALSPGINDPTTAVHALGHTSSLLCDMASRTLGPRFLCDEQKVVRAVLDRPDLNDLLEVALSQPRRYGAGEPVVLKRLLDLLRELAWTVKNDEHRTAIRRQLERLRITIAAQDFDSTDFADLDVSTANVERALAGQWSLRK